MMALAALLAAAMGPTRAAGAPVGATPPVTPGEPPPSLAADELPQADHLSSKFSVSDRDPEGSVPGARERDANPLEFGYFLQDLLEKAERARKDNDMPAVIRFYRAVAKAVPDNARGWSKLCEAYELVKDRDRAIKACRYALDRPAVELQDHVRYVNLILDKASAEGRPLAAAELTELNTVLAHLEKQEPKGSLDFTVNQLRCQVGVKMKDITTLEACTKALSRLAPDDPRTVVFSWTLALEKGQQREAEQLIDHAVKAGVVLENVERMRKVTAGFGNPNTKILRVAIPTIIAALIAALVVLAIKRRAAARPAR